MSLDMTTSMNNAATGAYRISASATKASSKAQETAAADQTAAENKAATTENAAVYEKSSADTTATSGVYEKAQAEKTSDSSKVDSKSTDRSALIEQLKADQETRQNQLMDIVRKTMAGQGKTLGTADDMWKFLAGGNFTVDAATKAQAQADIAEDGYWGVNQTSDRILDFAKALAGDDPEKADKMLDAFKKGYEQATKSWGKQLPDLSKQTYDAVLQKFDDWKNSAKTNNQTQQAQANNTNTQTKPTENYTTGQNSTANQTAAQTSAISGVDQTTT